MLDRLRVLAARLVGLFGRKQQDRDLAEELKAHLEMSEAENLRRGMTPTEARQAALRAFGGVTRVLEQYRDQRGLPLLNDMWKDLRYACRNLVRNPGFTAAAVLSLALGIGANSAMFSFVDALVLRPPDMPRPNEIVRVYQVAPEYRFNRVSYREYLAFRDHNKTLTGLVAVQEYGQFALKTQQSDLARLLFGYLVSGDFFSILEAQPAMGRTFQPNEDSAAATDVVAILSHQCWKGKFHSDPSVVGTKMMLNGQPATIIGVAPESFKGTDTFVRPEIYVPLAMASRLFPSSKVLVDPKQRSLSLFGRLRPGVQVPTAQADFLTIASSLEQSYPDTNRQRSVSVLPVVMARLQQAGADTLLAVILMGVVTSVLLIACMNVANLLLGRASTRAKEIAIRLSVGASRGRLIRQLLTESMVLAALGTVMGLLVAWWAIGFLASLSMPSDIPFELATRMDERVLLYSLALMAATAVLFGLAPAIRATKADLISPIKGSDAPSDSHRYRGRSVLVAAQIAMSVVLLVSAGLCVKSFVLASGTKPGFRTENILLMSFDPALVGYSKPRSLAFYQQLQERVRSLAGMRSVSLASHVQLGPSSSQRRVLREGTGGQDTIMITYNQVGAGFFETLDTPILRGRAIDSHDTEDAPRVAVVNETMARRLWPQGDAIGQHIQLTDRTGAVLEIVGIARDAKYLEAVEKPEPYFYVPYLQDFQSLMTLFAYTSGEPTSAVAAIRREIQALAPDVPVFDIHTMKEIFEQKGLLAARLMAQMVGAMGVIGLTLAVVGLYAVMAFAVNRRTKEIGIRMALGANSASVLRMVLAWGARVTITGMIIGVACALGVTRFFSEFLERVSPTDPATFAGVAVLLVLVALAACWIPARRASRVDPMMTLRDM